MRVLRGSLYGMLLLLGLSCSSDTPPADDNGTSDSNTEQPADDSNSDGDGTASRTQGRSPIRLGQSNSGDGAGEEDEAAVAARVERVMEALQPIQVLLGTWRGTTQKTFGKFHVVDESQWVWDLKSDKSQPALVATSDKSPYFREARVTFDVKKEDFVLHLRDEDGAEETFRGEFTKPPRDVFADGDRPQREFKLDFKTSNDEATAVTRVVFNQQSNDRFLLEVYGGRRSQRLDTVGCQRSGTSFALSDSDYRERTCIISAGLGTMQVSDPKSGKTYWVCCTGCKAAFEEDPQRWLDRMAKRGK